MKRSIFYVVTFLSLFSINLFSQDAECKKSFVQTIGSAGIDEANQFISYDNGFLVSGTANTKYFIMHLTENGEILWNYEIDIFPGVTEKATSMVLDGQNLVVVGNSAAQNGSIFNFVLKFDISNKTIVWLKIYPAVTYSTSVFTTILHETSADSYFILGQTQENSSPGLGCDALWLKVNKSSGDVTSAKNVNLGSCETYTGAVLGTNGFIYGAGRFNNAGGGQDKFRGSLTKLDLNGNEIWSKLYTKNIDNDDARLYFQTIAEDNGSLILGGQGDLTGTSTSVVDVLVMKTNLEGEIIWHKEVNIQGASSELATKLVTKNNSYYLMVNSLFAGNNEYSLLKFDVDGNLLWTKRYGRQSFDRGNDLIITTDNIFVVGETKGAGFGGDEILIIKSDLEGNGFNEGCNILTPVIATTKNTISAFQAIANTNEYNINFPLSAKTVPVVPLNLQVLDVCAVSCVDTCKNGVIAHTVPDAALENVFVECNGANLF
ncbi:MAG: hypothetical protein IPN86_24105 [Saprospiraceae bacterium]|nr:hypothetical protein [Saprospiraceae bacterium]